MTTPRTRTLLALGAATLLGAQLAGATSASAASVKPWKAPEVSYTKGNVFAHGDSAEVRAKYRCSPGTEMTHVWVSVKQGPGDLTQEGSSAIAKAYYDTNVAGTEPVLTCDGKWKFLTTTVLRHTDKDALQAGEAYVQFCLYAGRGEVVEGASYNRMSTIKLA
ncbi:hypothetical protein [Motilibacter peucedani]|nr:hypothetical protein [Motilibacter peucedani]